MDEERRKPLPPPRREAPLKSLPESDSNMPEWVQEYAGLMVIGAIILFVLGPIIIIKNLTPQENPYDPTKMARIQVSYGPVRLYAEGSNTKVESLKVTVKNYGPAAAAGVKVSAQLFGKDYPLSGADTILVGHTLDFEGPIGVHLSLKDIVTISARCSNCVQ